MMTNRIRELLENIEVLRNNLRFLIDEKKELLDCEILVCSRMIDKLLNEYYQLLNDEKSMTEDGRS